MEPIKTKAERRLERDIDDIANHGIEYTRENGFKAIKTLEFIDGLTISKSRYYVLCPKTEFIYTYMAIKGLKEWLTYAHRVEAYACSYRSQIVAKFVAYYVFAKVNPELHKAIFMHNYIPLDDLEEKHKQLFSQLSEEYDNLISQLINESQKIVENAIQDKDLVLPANMSAKIFTEGMWHGIYGYVARDLHNNNPNFLETALGYYRAHLRSNCDLLNWRPLSTEYDYNSELLIIMKTVFPQELMAFMTPELAQTIKKLTTLGEQEQTVTSD